MIKILKHFRLVDWLSLLIATILIVGQVYLDLELPDFMKKITENIADPTKRDMSVVLQNGGMMILCALGSLISAVIVAFITSKISSRLSLNLRNRLYEKTLDFSLEEINNFSTPSLITRTTNDITQVRLFIAMGLQALIKAPILAIWALLKISNTNIEWTLVTAGGVLMLIILVSIIIFIAIPKSKKIQFLTDNLNQVAREHLTGLRVIKAYDAEGYQKERFDKANDNITKTNLFVNRLLALFGPYMTFLMSTMVLAIYWIGAILINEAGILDKLTLFSEMVVFMQYAMQVIMAFILLTFIFIMLPRASVAAKRILEVINKEVKIKDGNTTKVENTTIEFKNVSFAYPDAEENVISNINFKVNEGETLAIIGSTGCGKTTIANLLMRFYDVTEGELLIGGVNIKDLKQSYLRSLFSYATQKAVIFKGSIVENINLDVDYNALSANKRLTLNEKSLFAAKTAQAAPFVQEKGINGYVAQGGSNFSGGQKQRLSIARAIARDPEIYIFDDTFSALDYKTDRDLRAELNKKTIGKTKIIVGQRIGTIKDADKIIVLEDGLVAGMGTHKELLENCEVYQEIASSQLSKEELANE